MRKIKDLIDFSFIYEALLDKYSIDQSRTAECPLKLFKYLLLKVIYTLSGVDTLERSRHDISFKYFSEISLNKISLTNTLKISRRLER